MTTICLVRHGETDWNLNTRYQGSMDIPLNETGQDQARRVAERLGRDPWETIVSSPLQRAMATAEAIRETTGIQMIEQDPQWQERAYGDAEGMTIPERLEKLPGDNWPGLEDYDEFRLRATRALDGVAAQHAGERVIVVCHGGVINAILFALSDGEIGSGITSITNTSISMLSFNDREWTIDTYNQTEHLDMMPVNT